MTGFSSIPAGEGAATTAGGELVGDARVRGPAWARMPLLTVSMLGLQIVWSMEMAWASPYLHDELGVKKSLVAMVFLAGPVSGLIVQPFIGVLADKSTSRFGRRRPFIIISGLICLFGILLLGYTRFFSGIFTNDGSSANKALTVALAVWSIFCIDFSINAVQASDRALLVDILPTTDQPLGNAWAAAMLGLGSVLAFFLGSKNLPASLPFLGDTQLKVLAALAAFVFVLVHGILAFSVTEKRLLPDRSHREKTSFIGIFKDIWFNMKSLPYVIQQICLVQFFAWVAWFPVLFYMTIYISELHTSPFESPTLEQENEGTRLGNRALFANALCSLVTSVIAPSIVKEKGKHKRWAIVDLGLLWAISLLLLSICLLSTLFIKSVGGTTFLSTLIGFSWAITQWAPFALLGEAILTTPSSRGHRNSVASVESIHLTDQRSRTANGNRLSAERNDEAQFLIGDEEDITPTSKALSSSDRPQPQDIMHDHEDRGDEEDDSEGDEEGRRAPVENGFARRLMSNDAARRSDVFFKPDDGMEMDDMEMQPMRRGPRRGEDNLAAKAGIILGIHNVAIVIPQFLSTGISSIVFAIFEPHRSVLKGPHPAPAQGPLPVNNTVIDAASSAVQNATITTMNALLRREMDTPDDSSPDSLGVVFRIGGVCAFVASMIAWRLYRLLKTQH